MNTPPFIFKDVPLARYTTFGIGGSAEYFAPVQDWAALKEALMFASAEDLAVTVLGGGSNVLITDAGISGLVIKNDIDGVVYEEQDDATLVHAGSGISWDGLVAETVEKGLWGIENLSGIPGTVGGGVVQNINAYGVTLADVVESVEALDIQTGKNKIFSRAACAFAYRTSYFKKSGGGKNFVITQVTLRLSKVSRLQMSYKSASQRMQDYFATHSITNPRSADVRAAVLEVRARIGMLPGQYKSAGSYFINTIVSSEAFERLAAVVREKYASKAADFSPWHWELPDGTVKISTAFLMECTPFNKTDFRAQCHNGTVGISPLHTLSLINVHNATAADVTAFAHIISEKVQHEFGVQLETEVCFL